MARHGLVPAHRDAAPLLELGEAPRELGPASVTFTLFGDEIDLLVGPAATVGDLSDCRARGSSWQQSRVLSTIDGSLPSGGPCAGAPASVGFMVDRDLQAPDFGHDRAHQSRLVDVLAGDHDRQRLTRAILGEVNRLAETARRPGDSVRLARPRYFRSVQPRVTSKRRSVWMKSC